MIDTTNARIVFTSLTRGGENLKRAVRNVRAQWQRGEISMEEYQRQADCALSLGVNALLLGSGGWMARPKPLSKRS